MFVRILKIPLLLNYRLNTYFQYFFLAFSNTNLACTCSSTYCIKKTIDSSEITYVSFKSYQGQKLNVETTLSNLSVTDQRQCLGSCTKLSNCSSVNFDQNRNMANCELLSENAYTRVNELIEHVDWIHFTAYVRLKFNYVFIWKWNEMRNSYVFVTLKITLFMSQHYISLNNSKILAADTFH